MHATERSSIRFRITAVCTVTDPAERQRLPRPVPEEDLHKFFAAIDDGRDRAMFLLMLRCGLRISEMAKLQLVDLFLDEPRPRLVAHDKGSKERLVYVSTQAEGAMRDYLVERPLVPSDYVFLSYLGNGMSTTAVHKRLMVYRQRAGVHCFRGYRHICATRDVKEGASVEHGGRLSGLNVCSMKKKQG